MSLPLLMTKIHPPRFRPGSVRRTVLKERIETGLRESKKLTLISAPAGYGKSTLLAELIETNKERDIAWLSLDENDNDYIVFIKYLIASLKSVDNSIGTATESLLTASKLLPVEVFLPPLINELLKINREIILVLDDYHVIKNPQVNEVVPYLINNGPESLHVIISTREDPSFPLSRLRVMDSLNELRADDLRFTPEEALLFFNESMGTNISSDLAASLDKITEGWIAGLQLAAISVKKLSEEKRSEFVEAFKGTHRYVIDYLVEETMKLLPDELTDFLKKTSILNRFCPELCDFLIERNDSREILERVEKQNLFIISLDDERKWFRYHHLFGEFLKSWLDRRSRKKLHLRASRWFELNGFYEEAITHAFAADDYEEVIRLLNLNAEEFFGSGKIGLFLNMIFRIPDDKANSNLELLIYRAWAQFATGDIAEVIKTIGYVSSNTTESLNKSTLGRFKGLQGWLYTMQGVESSEKIVREALDLLGEENTFFRIMTLTCLGSVLGRKNLRASSETFEKAMNMARKTGNSFAELINLLQLAFNYIIKCDFKKAANLCEEGISRYSSPDGFPLPITAMAYIPLGITYYAMNELEPARELLEKGMEFSRNLNLDRILGGDAERTLVMIYYALGEKEKAFAIIEKYDSGIEPSGLTETHIRNRALKSSLKLREGRIEEVTPWALEVENNFSNFTSPVKEMVYTTYINYLLRTDRSEEALEILSHFEKILENTGRSSTKMTILVLKAIALENIGKRAEAVATLKKAIPDISAANFKRLIIDSYDRIGHLLPEARPAAPGFVDDIIKIAGKKKIVIKTELAEPLTDREIEILNYIAGGSSNQEIAEKLFITVGTTKWHITNILGKLEVKNRTRAVARARELSIIN